MLGTLLSTFIFGFSIYILGAIGASYSFSLPESLVFGSLIGATDPVSTLSVFAELGVDPVLFALLFAESVLNDTVAIVLFKTFEKFIGSQHNTASVFYILGDFVYIFLGSTILGLLCGMLPSLVTKRSPWLQHHLSLELGFFLIAAYAPFLLAEMVHLSGIVCILFAGISMKHYASNNLSAAAKVQANGIFEVFAFLAETAVF